MEANEDFVLPVTVMIAIIASITIVISLQRLVQAKLVDRDSPDPRDTPHLLDEISPRPHRHRGHRVLLGAILGLLGMNGLLTSMDVRECAHHITPYPMASVLGIVGATMIVVVLAVCSRVERCGWTHSNPLRPQ